MSPGKRVEKCLPLLIKMTVNVLESLRQDQLHKVQGNLWKNVHDSGRCREGQGPRVTAWVAMPMQPGELSVIKKFQ